MGHHPYFTLLLLDVRFRRGTDVPGRSCSWGGNVLSCLDLSLSLLCALPPSLPGLLRQCKAVDSSLPFNLYF